MRASPETGVTRLRKMKLSRLLAVSGLVNTCHVHWLFFMSINCIMTQGGKEPFVLMVKYQKHPTSSKQGYAYFWSLNAAINPSAELTGEKNPQGERFSGIKSVSKKKEKKKKDTDNKQKKTKETDKKIPSSFLFPP